MVLSQLRRVLFGQLTPTQCEEGVCVCVCVCDYVLHACSCLFDCVASAYICVFVSVHLCVSVCVCMCVHLCVWHNHACVCVRKCTCVPASLSGTKPRVDSLTLLQCDRQKAFEHRAYLVTAMMVSVRYKGLVDYFSSPPFFFSSS